MRFGQKDEDRYEIRYNQIQNWMKHGKRKFAFIPIKLDDGQWLWLENYRVFLTGYNETRHYMELSNSALNRYFRRKKAENDLLIEKLKGE